MQAKSGVSFNFTKLLVGDLDKSALFYAAVFKLEEQFRVEDQIEGRPIHEIMYQPTHDGAASFVLLSFGDAPQPVQGEVILGFTVGDLDQVIADAQAHGGRLTDPIREMPDLGIRVGFIRDPEGHLIEVVQMLQA